METSSHRVTQICRVVLTVMVFVAWCWSGVLDAQVEWLWRGCRESALFRHDSFEPFVVTVGFLLSMIFFYNLDVCIPSARRWRIHKDANVRGTWKTQIRSRYA